MGVRRRTSVFTADTWHRADELEVFEGQKKNSVAAYARAFLFTSSLNMTHGWLSTSSHASGPSPPSVTWKAITLTEKTWSLLEHNASVQLSKIPLLNSYFWHTWHLQRNLSVPLEKLLKSSHFTVNLILCIFCISMLQLSRVLKCASFKFSKIQPDIIWYLQKIWDVRLNLKTKFWGFE